MDFKLFQRKISGTQSSRWSARQKRLDAYRRALNGKLYDHVGVAFSQERTGNGWDGDRVLLDDRRASVEDQLPAEAAREMCGLLFGESHRPVISARDDENTTKWINAFIRDAHFWLIMMQVLWEASVGSTCLVLRVLGKQEVNAQGGFTPKGKGAYYFEIWPAHECRPTFHRTAPGELKQVERIWFLGSDALTADGYNVEELLTLWRQNARAMRIRRPTVVSSSSAKAAQSDENDWVLRIILDQKGEQWFIPTPRWIYERTDWKDSKFRPDGERTFIYKDKGVEINETPARWIVPLPLNRDLAPDGCSLFGDVLVNYQFRIDRTLSQTGRAFDYAGDPQLAKILEGAAGNPDFGSFESELAVGGTASDVLEQTGGDIKFVEAKGDALAVAIEKYVPALKDAARATSAMSRITPDNKSLTQLSAVAMKILNAAQYALADVLRITVGEDAGTAILKLAMRLALTVDVALPTLEENVQPNPEAILDHSWPEYIESHGQDKLFEVQSLAQSVEAGLLSRETGVANAAPMFDVQNAAEEHNRIQDEQKTNQQTELDTADKQAQIAAKYEKPKTPA
jgi:hypothetical protein